MAIKLGETVSDKITGFTGIVTGITKYMDGSAQCQVVPKCKDSRDYPKGEWIDEFRLEVADPSKPIGFGHPESK